MPVSKVVVSTQYRVVCTYIGHAEHTKKWRNWTAFNFFVSLAYFSHSHLLSIHILNKKKQEKKRKLMNVQTRENYARNYEEWHDTFIHNYNWNTYANVRARSKERKRRLFELLKTKLNSLTFLLMHNVLKKWNASEAVKIVKCCFSQPWDTTHSRTRNTYSERDHVIVVHIVLKQRLFLCCAVVNSKKWNFISLFVCDEWTKMLRARRTPATTIIHVLWFIKV